MSGGFGAKEKSNWNELKKSEKCEGMHKSRCWCGDVQKKDFLQLLCNNTGFLLATKLISE